MAEVFVPVRSVKQYFNEYAVDGIGKKHADRDLIKQQLLDAFQKEIFGQITMRYHDAYILAKPEDEVPSDVKEGVNKILQNSLRKWRRLCELFAGYKETRMLIEERDLMQILDDIVQGQTSPEVLETEDGTIEVVKEG